MRRLSSEERNPKLGSQVLHLYFHRFDWNHRRGGVLCPPHPLHGTDFLVEDDSVILGLEPFHGLFFGDPMLAPNLVLGAPTT